MFFMPDIQLIFTISFFFQGYNELRIDLEYNGEKYFANYSSFSIDDELSSYKLSVNWSNGTANDSLAYHNGMRFSTFDKDNDDAADKHCSKDNAGGWWYRNCRHANLNGRWGLDDDAGVIWESLSKIKSVSFTEMKIRHVQINKTQKHLFMQTFLSAVASGKISISRTWPYKHKANMSN